MKFDRSLPKKQLDGALQSYREEKKSQLSYYAGKSEAGRMRNNDSFINKSYKKPPTLKFESDFGDLKEVERRKILYRVSKKIYTPDEIEFIRDQVLASSRRSTKKFLHFFTSICMIILILAMCGTLIYRIYQQWSIKYELNLASVSIQNPNVTNYVSNVTVIRYFLYDNTSGDTFSLNGVQTVRLQTAYTNLHSLCDNNNKTFVDIESKMKTIQDSTDSPFKLIYDLIFIIIMLLCMAYIIRRTWKPLKIYRVPLTIRSNNVSPWSYKQRFKL